jgi:peptidoglycan hydrolase-like protein with peptidoglycan-binding domain
MTGTLALSLTPLAFAAKPQSDIKKAQGALRDKGYDPGKIDGHLGPQTRRAIGQYQKAEDLRVTEHLDAQTANKLGVEQESVGSSFKAAGQDVGQGGEQLGHEVKKGKPIAAGKELGKGIGGAAKKVVEGVKKAVSTDSDRGESKRTQ